MLIPSSKSLKVLTTQISKDQKQIFIVSMDKQQPFSSKMLTTVELETCIISVNTPT